jgi:molybdopterin converting factor small subunit
MKITLKLFATLADRLPEGAHANAAPVEVPAGATPNQVIDQFQVPRDRVHLVLLNGVYVDAPDRDRLVIHAGDSLAIWPPVAGG